MSDGDKRDVVFVGEVSSASSICVVRCCWVAISISISSGVSGGGGAMGSSVSLHPIKPKAENMMRLRHRKKVKVWHFMSESLCDSHWMDKRYNVEGLVWFCPYFLHCCL